MGYESRLYVVEKGSRTTRRLANGNIVSTGHVIDGVEMFYAYKISVFDLGKVSTISSVMRDYPETNQFIYFDDGNTEIIYDNYGDRLKEIPLGDAINILKSAAEVDNYRRYFPCIAALESIKNNKDSWGEVVVLHFGY